MRAASSLAVAVAIAGLMPAAAHAQLARSRSDQTVLVLWPCWNGCGTSRQLAALDSVFAVQLGDQIREKLDAKERLRMRVVPRARICEILMGSGFRCPEPLDPANADRLADAMKTYAYMVGTLTRNSNPTLHLRMVDQKKTGIAGWITIVADTSWKVDRFASVVVDSIDSHLRAAESVRDCYDRLDHNDLKGAREKVADAFKLYPNQPAAAMCLSRIFDAQHSPVDSIIFAFEKVVKGDSVNGKAWDRLAGAYQEKNDIQRAVEARTHQLEAQPENAGLRTQVAAGWIGLKQVQRGVDILDVGLQNNPLDGQALRIKQQACIDAQLWKCALSALTALYEADTTFLSDSVFYAKAFGAAQSVNDTAAMLKWSGLAVKHIPNSLTMWRARANALKTAGRSDSALVAYQHVLQYDTTDVGVTLIVVQGLVGGMVIDTVTPLDTGKLRTVDSYLTRVLVMSKDSVVRGSVGGLYANVGLRVAQTKKYDALSDSLMTKALAQGVRGPVYERLNFFLGLHTFQKSIQGGPGAPGLPEQIQALGKTNPPRALTAAENARGCQLLSEELAAVAKIKPAMTAGRSVVPQAAATILGYMAQLETQAGQVKSFFKCR
jgi:tetratricopeptide (TPR) repeat protein